MFIKTFKKNYTMQIILIILLPLILWIPAFMSSPEVIKTNYDAPFYNLIYNVIDNAVKYSENEAIIQISSKENNKGLQLNFSDKGVGIPANDLPFVFDKFFRVAREDSKDIEGFGIGLSYVKRVCEWHKWKVEAKNNEEKGITITIQINKNDYE